MSFSSWSSSPRSWFEKNQEIVKKQTKALQSDKGILALFLKFLLQVVFRPWSDVSRYANSAFGSNITDNEFFLLDPTVQDASKAKHDSQMVLFPAVRPNVFRDDVTLADASKVILSQVIDRNGVKKQNVSVKELLKNLGQYIPDLLPSADYSDATDNGKIQVAHQFSVLPATKKTPAQIGIASFDYQMCNCHMIIGPNGETGYGISQEGTTKLFFIENGSYRVIQVAAEDDEKVVQAFFKKVQPDETPEEQAKRTENVTNYITHIQMEITRPDLSQHRRQTKGGGGSGFAGFAMACASSYQEKGSVQCMALDSISMDKPVLRSMAMEDDEPTKFTLGKVTAGRHIGYVPVTSKLKVDMKRAPGVGVRVTRMFYGVDSDATMTPETIEPFIKQMTLLQRQLKAEHGSLVMGELQGLKLKPFPSSEDGLMAHFKQIPCGDLQVFLAGGNASMDSSLAVGQVRTCWDSSGTVYVIKRLDANHYEASKHNDFVVQHPGVLCDGCNKPLKSDVRYKCSKCHNMDFCAPCWPQSQCCKAKHNFQNIFDSR